MSYGARMSDAYHQLGVYVARILNGDTPADLPVMLPSRFEICAKPQRGSLDWPLDSSRRSPVHNPIGRPPFKATDPPLPSP
jgi:hypothetical protein